MDLVAQSSATGRQPIVFSPDERLAGEGRSETPRILIVEDDYIVGLELESGLSDAGFEVIGIASSAEEAVRLAVSERPILAVMDIRLAGGRDGIEAALEMFDVCGVRCIFATAHSDAATQARADQAAPLGWLPKPYQLDAMVSMIKGAIAELKKSRT
jgi:DNA-binding NarL/FixJ family response regulator